MDELETIKENELDELSTVTGNTNIRTLDSSGKSTITKFQKFIDNIISLVTSNFIKKDGSNTFASFTPTTDYQPIYKKYVDDELTDTVSTITGITDSLTSTISSLNTSLNNLNLEYLFLYTSGSISTVNTDFEDKALTCTAKYNNGLAGDSWNTGLFFTPTDDQKIVEVIITGTVSTSAGPDTLGIRIDGIIDSTVDENIVSSLISCDTESRSFTALLYGKVNGDGDMPLQIKSVSGDTITISNLKISIKTLKPIV